MRRIEFVYSLNMGLNYGMKNSLPIVLAMSIATGCATGSINSSTGPGFIYSNHYEGVLVTANQAGRKRGEACTTNILGLFTSGDASLSAAMKDGAITVVSSVDHSYKSILGVHGKMCTIVTGN
jgi:hypothetical protein